VRPKLLKTPGLKILLVNARALGAALNAKSKKPNRKSCHDY